MTLLGNAVPSPRAVLRGLVAVLIAGALTVLASAAASAASYTHRDPAGDVVLVDASESGTPAPQQARGDVIATAIAHTRSSLVLKVRLRAGLPADGWFVGGDIRTPRGTFAFTLGRVGGYSNFELTRGRSEKKVRCAGLRRSLTSGRSVVRVVVPRSCLGAPRFIRAGIGVVAFAPGTEYSEFYADDALRRGVPGDLQLSPRLRRG